MRLTDQFPWLRDAAGLFEPAATMGTAMAAEIPAGLYGLYELARTRDPAIAAEGVRSLQDRYTYTPRTEQGMRNLGRLGEGMERAMDWGGLLGGPSMNDVIATAQEGSSRLFPPAVSAAIEGVLAAPPPARATRLPMGAARLKRARDIGFDTDRVYYHGTTHDFDEFGRGNYEKGGHFGGGDYFTSSADDASRHYAGEGPDLTNRIQSRAEQIANEFDWDYDDPRALEMAREQLKGPHGGALMPVYLRKGNSFEPDNSRKWLENDPIDLSDFADEDDYYEALDAAEGPLQRFRDSIAEQADEHGFDASPILEQLYEPEISHSQLDDIMRNTEWYAEDYNTGELINNEVYRQALKDAGFDSIDMSATAPGWNMDIEEGTRHIISLDPSQIRSINAEFDPAKRSSANILAGSAAGAIGLGMLQDEEELPPYLLRRN